MTIALGDNDAGHRKIAAICTYRSVGVDFLCGGWRRIGSRSEIFSAGLAIYRTAPRPDFPRADVGIHVRACTILFLRRYAEVQSAETPRRFIPRNAWVRCLRNVCWVRVFRPSNLQHYTEHHK